MRPAGRRRQTESLAPDRRPPPPTPTNTVDPWGQYNLSTPVPGRDSDASFCSSLPSLASAARPADRSSALRAINSYLASQSLPFSLKHPLPSNKDTIETLRHLLARLGFPPSAKFDEDLMHALKFLKCPHKVNRSALKSPATPHTFPSVLAVMHWLVQLIKYNDFVGSSGGGDFEKIFMYTINSYLLYISGEDEGADALDEEIVGESSQWRDKVEESVRGLEGSVKELEAKLDGLRTGPSLKEAAEHERAVLEKDVTKFHIMIEQLDGHLVEVQKKLEEKDGALEAKVADRKRICEENEELSRKIVEQGINLKDAERMKRELQAVERDIEELEAARNGWEEKIWELDSEIGHRFKELERIVMECNQAIRRLKLSNGFQYQLNPKGSTPSEVIGLEYKSVLKPTLASYAEDIKKSSMGKFEELISLRQQAGANAVKLEEKRNRISTLQSHIDQVEAHLNSMRKETHEFMSRCAAEARKLAEEVDKESQEMSVVEKEAEEFLKTSKAELQETTTQTEEEVKLCAHELFSLINSVSTYKEYMESKIARMRNDLFETAGVVADIYKGYHPR